MGTGRRKAEKLVFSLLKFDKTIYHPPAELGDYAKKEPQGITAMDLVQRVAKTTAACTAAFTQRVRSQF